MIAKFSLYDFIAAIIPGILVIWGISQKRTLRRTDSTLVKLILALPDGSSSKHE